MDRGEWILDGDEWTMEVNRWQMESNGGQANKRWKRWTTLDNRRRKGRRTDQGRRQIPTWRAQMCGESTMKNSRLSSSLSKPMVTTTIHYYYDNAIRRHWSRINTSNYYKQMGKTGRVLLYKLTAAQYNLAKYTTCYSDKWLRKIHWRQSPLLRRKPPPPLVMFAHTNTNTNDYDNYNRYSR